MNEVNILKLYSGIILSGSLDKLTLITIPLNYFVPH